MKTYFLLSSIFFVSIINSCSSSKNQNQECSLEAQTGCESGFVCESVEGEKPSCFRPVIVTGRIVQSSDTSTGISNARVVARDINNALVSRDIATSNADGTYELMVPMNRKKDGSPIPVSFTLRADALKYSTFPSGLRIAFPVDSSAPAKQQDNRWVIQNASTTIQLDALPTSAPMGTIKGFVRSNNAAGTLIVAGSATGIASKDGSFVVFNVPSGTIDVRGYQAGIQLKPSSAIVVANTEVTGIELISDSTPLATVTGDVSFVNANASTTSVILVVKSTFNTSLLRGEVPKGLRVANATGKYEIPNVPIGQYVVLAAFENDNLVRDPDQTIGGTAIQEISVQGSSVQVPSFKITGALSVTRPGADVPETVSGTPVFEWADDSSEDGYEVYVYDGFGNKIWEKKDVPRVTGSATVSLNYAGPALQKGYYQFRAYSFRNKQNGKTYISSTEDLRGVFIK